MSKEIIEKTELLSMKDVKNVDDFSFDKVEMLRGITPENLNEKCLELCQNYLGGIWLKQTVDTIQVKRLSGGLTNQMYYCGLNDQANAEGVPHEVVVRFYGSKHWNYEEGANERLPDVIINLMLSENNLGPKIYGIFENGEIQGFYKVSHLMAK